MSVVFSAYSFIIASLLLLNVTNDVLRPYLFSNGPYFEKTAGLGTRRSLLSYPESVVYDYSRQRYLVSCQGNGTIVSIDSNGNQNFFATGLGSVLGLCIKADTIYAVCNNSIKGLLLENGVLVFNHSIPEAVKLNDIATDGVNNLYVSDVLGNKIFEIDITTYQHAVLVSQSLSGPNGIMVEPERNRLLIVSWRAQSPVQAVNLETGEITTVLQTQLSNCDGLTKDNENNYYVSEWYNGTIRRFDPSLSNSTGIIYSSALCPADIYFNSYNNEIAIPLVNGNSLDIVSLAIAIEEIENRCDMLAYPNPFLDEIFIKISSRIFDEAELSIYNMKGILVYFSTVTRKDFIDKDFRISTSAFEGGIYVLRIKEKSGLFSKCYRLVKTM